MASMTNINIYMKDNYQQYASNDSGLSVTSNGAGGNCQRHLYYQDFVCDDLTKSLFINSLSGNDLIQDDDIYSYKSKMEISSIFQNKLRSFNLAKTDNFNFKNSCSFSSIINDMENLKMSESIPPSINNTVWKPNNDYRDNLTIPSNLSNVRITDEVKDNIRSDYIEKIRPKRSVKKNGVNEYLSSSIKDYKGDKALNEIVSFIQGSPKSNKTVTSNKSKPYKNPSIKVDECSSLMTKSCITIDSGLTSDNSSPQCNDMIQSSTDTDSGTQSSQFVSLNNSDEDSSQVIIADFQEVLSKKQRKTTCLKVDIQNISLCSANTPLNLKCEIPNKNVLNKTKKCAKAQTRVKSSNNLILNSRENFQHFLSNQYTSFMKKYNAAS